MHKSSRQHCATLGSQTSIGWPVLFCDVLCRRRGSGGGRRQGWAWSGLQNFQRSEEQLSFAGDGTGRGAGRGPATDRMSGAGAERRVLLLLRGRPVACGAGVCLLRRCDVCFFFFWSVGDEGVLTIMPYRRSFFPHENFRAFIALKPPTHR
jgi:hypothetical protein